MKKFVLAATALMVASVPAFAADIPAPVYKAPVVAPIAFTWTGWYVGANGGYSWGRGSTDLTETQTTTSVITQIIGTNPGTPGPLNGLTTSAITAGSGSGSANVNGWLGGLQAGRNWQYNQWVFGLEADAQLTGQRGDVTICFPTGCPTGTTLFGTASYKLPWFATFRGRAGVAWDRVLFYATGGLAVGEVKASYTDGLLGGTFAATGGTNTTRFGWVVGAGIEGAINNNWSIKVEYLYMDLGSFSGTASGSTTSQLVLQNNVDGFRAITTTNTFVSNFNTRMTDNIVRVGLNYRFGAVDAVVTKY
jgi:outer membrane immunogenic protein